MSQITSFFGAPSSTPISSFLNRGGNYSAYYDPSNINIPASGPIRLSNFYGARKNHFYYNSSAVHVIGGYNIGPWGYSAPGGDTSALWIWNTPGANGDASLGPWIHFYKSFTAASTFTATFYIICDNDAYVFLNGKLISNINFGGGWGGTGASVTVTINQGLNLIDIFGYNRGGPGGLIASLYNGSSLVLNTNSSWTYFTSSLTNNCMVIYGCRRINPFYDGPIFNIRRSSDNAIQDFYSDFNQSFIATALSGGMLLSTWLNGATGYVVRWYDQSGNGNHATNTSNNASQPNLSLQNNRYVLQFQNANATLLTITTPIQSKTVFCHFWTNNTTGWFNAILTTQYWLEVRFLGPNGTSITGGDENDWYYQATLNGGACLAYNNGVPATDIAFSAWNYLALSVTTPRWTQYQNGYDPNTAFNRIGYDSYSPIRSMNGYMSELICHNTPQLDNDIKYFYNSRIF